MRCSNLKAITTKRLVSWAMIASVASAASAQAPQPPPPPRWDLVVFETKSWDKLLSSWSLDSKGSGSWVNQVSYPHTGKDRKVWHEIGPDVQTYIFIEQQLAGLPQPAPNYRECANFLPDMPYGTLRLSNGATTTEIAWNSGCRDDSYARFLEILRTVDQFMKAKGLAAHVSREEQVP